MAGQDPLFITMPISAVREFRGSDGKDARNWERVGVAFIMLDDKATARDKEDIEKLLDRINITLEMIPMPEFNEKTKQMSVRVFAFPPRDNNDDTRPNNGNGHGRDGGRDGGGRGEGRDDRGRDDRGRGEGGGRFRD
jgi:hypothetical protein